MSRRFPVSRATRDNDPLAVFIRGATVGAFAGAAIAGSTIWRRVRRHAASGPVASAAAKRAVSAVSASTPSDPTASALARAQSRPSRGVPPMEDAEPHRP